MSTKTLPPNGRVIGPTGIQLTEDNLPPPNTVRWVIRRKAEVLAAIRGGLISQEEACDRYGLSVEELLSWQALIEGHGMRGLRVTRTQQYRATPVSADDRSETDQPRTNGVARSERRPPMVGATDDSSHRQSLNGGARRKHTSSVISDGADASSQKQEVKISSGDVAPAELEK